MRLTLIFISIMGIFLKAAEPAVREDALIFCIHKSSLPLNIQIENNNISTGNKVIDEFIIRNQIISIEPWILGASDLDHDGDIYLNRIYRIILSEKNRSNLSLIKEELVLMNEILSVENEYIRKPIFQPNDNNYGQQWYLDAIKADLAWDSWDIPNDYPGDEFVLLASVDTGVDWDHPDLRDNIWNNLGEDIDGDGVTMVQQGGSWIFDPGDVNAIDDDGNGYIDDFIGWDCSGYSNGQDNNPRPPTGVSNGGIWAHGTHVAGILSASTNNNLGMASTAFDGRIICVKVSTGEQSYPYITHGYTGILYAAKAGYYAGGFTILNNSWGGQGYSTYEQTVINIAHNDYNAVVVAAGGNGNEDSWGEDEFAHYPSSYQNVVSVCPLGNNYNWNHWATYHSTIDIAAPGESIFSTIMGTGYSSWTGSSMASPLAASVIGLMRSKHPDWNNNQLISMVLNTADPIIYSINSEPYLQGKLGSGVVNAELAVTTELFPLIELVGLDILIIGDDNGVINQGETAEVRMILFNNPDWGAAEDVFGNVSLVSSNSNISFSDEMANFGSGEPGDALLNEIDPFIIEFSSTAPIGLIEFELNIISNLEGYLINEQSLPFSIEVFQYEGITGDLNQDNIVNILDIVQIVNIILGNNPTPYQLSVGDLNDDGVLNVLDIINIINLIMEQ